MFLTQPMKASFPTKRGHTCEEEEEKQSHMWEKVQAARVDHTTHVRQRNV
jgi:hypothetical protein